MVIARIRMRRALLMAATAWPLAVVAQQSKEGMAHRHSRRRPANRHVAVYLDRYRGDRCNRVDDAVGAGESQGQCDGRTNI